MTTKSSVKPDGTARDRNHDAPQAMTILQFMTKVHFGHGLRSELPGELARLEVKRPLLVTDKGIVEAGVFDQALSHLPQAAAYPVFDEVPVNPTEEAAEDGAARYRAEGCDGVVAIGGGAALDLAKAIAILSRHPPPLWDFCNRHAQPRAIVDPPPLVVLPTTAGSGSEVGRSAVVIFNNGIKAGVGCPAIVKAAICDPDLTLSLPPRLTAATGMDAVAHCLETFCSPTINPPADAVVLDGLARLSANIRQAVSEGSDRAARWNMMMGALEGAIGFQKGMGAVHALSHPLGARGHHHGTLNAILLPHVLAYNAAWLGEKIAVIKRTMKVPPRADLSEALWELISAIGLPLRLADLGIGEDGLAAIAAAALDDNAHKTNPRPLTQADYETLLQAAF